MAAEDQHRNGDPFEACANCGTSFEIGIHYPALTRQEPDGSLGLYSFCDRDCQAAWEAEH